MKLGSQESKSRAHSSYPNNAEGIQEMDETPTNRNRISSRGNIVRNLNEQFDKKGSETDKVDFETHRGEDEALEEESKVRFEE